MTADSSAADGRRVRRHRGRARAPAHPRAADAAQPRAVPADLRLRDQRVGGGARAARRAGSDRLDLPRLLRRAHRARARASHRAAPPRARRGSVRRADRHAAHGPRARDDLSHRHRPRRSRLGGRIHSPAGVGRHRTGGRDRGRRAAAQLSRALPLHLRVGTRRRRAAAAADHPGPRHRRQRRRVGLARLLLVPAR